MNRFVFLDTGPLAVLTQRRGHAEAEACREWWLGIIAAGARIFIPEIADYEVRRELLRAGKAAAVARLDRFISDEANHYVPLTTAAMRCAAALWAEARNRGLPTAAHDALDGDVILAAQVLDQGLPPSECVVATTNVAHLSRFVNAAAWRTIQRP